MIRRKRDPFSGKLALPGGFVNEGETVEEAARREALEETSLQVEPIEILGVYSDPKRDPRKHVLSVVFVGIVVGGSQRAGDDAEVVEWIEPEQIPNSEVAFDHTKIIRDYVHWRSSGGTFWSSRRND